MIDLLVAIFYQPFLNALVLIYDGLSHIIDTPDMGIAVIIFSLGIRVALLPLTLKSTQSAEERRKIGKAFAEISTRYKSSEPLKFQEERRKLVEANRSTVRFEIINLFIQLTIAVILWRVFDKGLKGEDLHLLYSFVPKVTEPFNLTFLGKIDLTRPNLTLNIISSILLFLVETLNTMFSPLPATREDRFVQFALPIITFLYLYTMPAGKKFFVITTLLFSICFIMIRELRNVWFLYSNRK